MDKIERSLVFRANLEKAMSQSGFNRAQLAQRTNIDRSTLGQLLQEDGVRLPNGHTIAAIAATLGVSTDWLLGLSNEEKPLTTFLDGAVNFTAEAQRAPIDDNFLSWYREAEGAKVRFVPTTLPDLFKTQAVLQFEYRDYAVKTGAQAIADRDERLNLAKVPDTDLEICFPIQRLTQFANGQGTWEGLCRADRLDQLHFLSDQLEAHYPTVRVYGFDLRTLYSVPFSVFGVKRAVIYLGQGYFILNTSGHIRHMIKHFDSLVRNATIHAHQMADHVRTLAETLSKK